MPALDHQPPPAVLPTEVAAQRLRTARVLVAGLGNIGSYLATLLAPAVAFVRLVDRDRVERRNSTNQYYSTAHEGWTKVGAAADHIAQLAPRVEVERRPMDLEDMPWGDLADMDVVLAGLDSLRARQVLCEKAFTLGIPYIDGAVGEPLLVRVQVQLPGQSCLQCGWGPEHYRQLTTEYPCRPGATVQAPATSAVGCAGATTASLMVAQCYKLFGPAPPEESYEISGDLDAGRLVTARRRLNPKCRFAHEPPPQQMHLDKPLCEATVGDLVAAVERQFADHAVQQLEFRRGILPSDMYGDNRFADLEQLRGIAGQRLDRLGLTAADRVVVRTDGRAQPTHILLAT